MARMRVGGRKGLRKRNVFFIVSVLFFVITMQSFWYIEKKIEPVLKNYAEIKVAQLASNAINEAIKKKIVDSPTFNDLFRISKDNDGKIQALSLDVRATNRIQAEAHNNVKMSLDKISAERIEIPLGVVLDSNILATLGPDIPVSMVPVGAVEVQLVPTIQQVGINNVFITVYLQIKTRVKVIIPFSSKEAELMQSVAIAQELIVGEVPHFYFDTNGDKIPFQIIPPGSSR